MTPREALEKLGALEARLEEAGRSLASARPPARVVTGAADAMTRAIRELARVEAGEWPPADRLEVIGAAKAVRARLRVVGRLVTGAARFAALLADEGGGARRGLYGPGGRAGADRRAGYERRA